MEEKTALQRLEDLIDARFDGLEKQLSERNRYNEDKILELKKKDIEQDNRLSNHAERIRKLETARAVDDTQSNPKKTTWDKIKDALIAWAVPFILACIIFYMTRGGLK